MAAERDFSEEGNKTEPDGTGPEGVDALVSSFLEELTAISAGMTPAEEIPEAGAAGVAEPERDEEVSPLLVQEIDNEVRESLDELERLKSKVVPIADRRDSRLEARQAPPPAEIVVPSAPPPAEPGGPEEPWSGAELFRRSLSSQGAPAKTLTPLFIGVSIGVLAVIVGAILFFRQGPQSPPRKPALAPSRAVPAPAVPQAAPVGPSEAASPEPLGAAPPLQAPMSAETRPVPREKARAPSIPAAKAREEEPARPARAPASVGTKTAAPMESATPVAPAPAPQVSAPAGSSPPAAAPPPVVTPAPVRAGEPVPAPQTNAAPSPPVRAAEPAPAPAPAAPPPAASTSAIQAVSIKKVPPVYPELAKRQRITGTVEVEAEISDGGDVVRAKAVSGPALLRAPAEEAVKKWKFKPASVNGANVSSSARILVDFGVR